jgi:hypothetical protein
MMRHLKHADVPVMTSPKAVIIRALQEQRRWRLINVSHLVAWSGLEPKLRPASSSNVPTNLERTRATR